MKQHVSDLREDGRDIACSGRYILAVSTSMLSINSHTSFFHFSDLQRRLTRLSNTERDDHLYMLSRSVYIETYVAMPRP